MTTEQQIIAIAEACGWTKCEHVASINFPIGIPPANNPPKYGTYENGMAQLPDYPNNLNAMHEAEERLLIDDTHAFACYLSDLFEVHGCGAIHATAAQRAEAFLRTIGKWEVAA
jgi:hypothetical protein